MKTLFGKTADPSRITGLTVALTCLLAFVISGCQPAGEGQTGEVTFTELFSHPDQYQERQITLEGFCFLGFEVMVLSEGLEYSGYAEGHLIPQGRMLWIEGGIPPDTYNQLYRQDMMGPDERYGKMRISGQFEHGGHYGHLGQYDSQITLSEAELLDWAP
jgi:hypothetical protein